jgi:hypothetical protein
MDWDNKIEKVSERFIMQKTIHFYQMIYILLDFYQMIYIFNSLNKYPNAFDTVWMRIWYITWRIEIFYSLWPAIFLICSDISRYFSVSYMPRYVLILFNTSWIHPDISLIRPDVSLILHGTYSIFDTPRYVLYTI